MISIARSQLAKVDQASVDLLVDALVYEGGGDWARVQARAERGALEKLKRVLSKVSDVPGMRDQFMGGGG
jgi:hypothetical protein